MPIPTKDQLNPFPGDLDGRVVVENLLGKSVDDAVALLEENGTRFQEDYMWMGAEAFVYYAPALVRYLRSPAAAGDYVVAYFMLSTFKHRLDHDGARITTAFRVIEEFCDVLEEDRARLGFDDDYIKRAGRRIAEVKAKIEQLEDQ
jgi:hypothetical protein